MPNTTCAFKIFLVDKIFQAIQMINMCSCTVKVNIDRFNVNVQKYQHHNSILKENDNSYVFVPTHFPCFYAGVLLLLSFTLGAFFENIFRLISKMYLYIPNETNVKVLCHTACTMGISASYNTHNYYIRNTRVITYN